MDPRDKQKKRKVGRPRNTASTFFEKQNFAKLIAIAMVEPLSTGVLKNYGVFTNTWYNTHGKQLVEYKILTQRQIRELGRHHRPEYVYDLNWNTFFNVFFNLFEEQHQRIEEIGLILSDLPLYQTPKWSYTKLYKFLKNHKSNHKLLRLTFKSYFMQILIEDLKNRIDDKRYKSKEFFKKSIKELLDTFLVATAESIGVAQNYAHKTGKSLIEVLFPKNIEKYLPAYFDVLCINYRILKLFQPEWKYIKDTNYVFPPKEFHKTNLTDPQIIEMLKKQNGIINFKSPDGAEKLIRFLLLRKARNGFLDEDDLDRLLGIKGSGKKYLELLEEDEKKMEGIATH